MAIVNDPAFLEFLSHALEDHVRPRRGSPDIETIEYLNTLIHRTPTNRRDPTKLVHPVPNWGYKRPPACRQYYRHNVDIASQKQAIAAVNSTSFVAMTHAPNAGSRTNRQAVLLYDTTNREIHPIDLPDLPQLCRSSAVVASMFGDEDGESGMCAMCSSNDRLWLFQPSQDSTLMLGTPDVSARPAAIGVNNNYAITAAEDGVCVCVNIDSERGSFPPQPFALATRASAICLGRKDAAMGWKLPGMQDWSLSLVSIDEQLTFGGAVWGVNSNGGSTSPGGGKPPSHVNTVVLDAKPTSIRISKDGDVLAAALNNSTVLLFDKRWLGEPLHRILPNVVSDPIGGVAISAKLYEVYTLQEHTVRVTSTLDFKCSDLICPPWVPLEHGRYPAPEKLWSSPRKYTMEPNSRPPEGAARPVNPSSLSVFDDKLFIGTDVGVLEVLRGKSPLFKFSHTY